MPRSEADAPRAVQRKLRPLRWWQIAVMGALTTILYVDVVSGLVLDWWTDDAYSHGLLVLPIALYLAWSRRREIASRPATQANSGVVLVLLGCLSYLVGQLGAEFFTTRLSLLVLLAGMIWTFWGWRSLRALAFPLLLIGTAIPLPAILYNELAQPLQLLASNISGSALQFMGIPVYQDGNILQLAGMSLGVAEACSGLRSIASLTVLALLIGHVQSSGIGLRAALLLISIPIAIAVNVLRVTGTALLVDLGNPGIAMGFYHSFSGWLVFIGGLGMLWLTAKLFLWCNRTWACRLGR